jgi:hypothetical protein
VFILLVMGTPVLQIPVVEKMAVDIQVQKADKVAELDKFLEFQLVRPFLMHHRL